MAKQVGPVFFTGTIDGIIFYKLGDQYYSRSKGSYKSAKHMRRSPKYARTMQRADQFGLASKLVKEVYYRHLPKAIRKHGLYGKLTGLANGWLQEGKSKEAVQELLVAHCQSLVAAATQTTAKEEPAGTKEQPPTVNRPLFTVNRHLSAANRYNQRPTTTKPTRYLSRWSIKPNGRLQAPRRLVNATQRKVCLQRKEGKNPEIVNKE